MIELLLIANMFLFFGIGFVGMFKGFDLKKWANWLYGVYGFLSGLMIGLFYFDFQKGATLGLFFAFFVMYGGATTYWHRQRYK